MSTRVLKEVQAEMAAPAQDNGALHRLEVQLCALANRVDKLAAARDTHVVDQRARAIAKVEAEKAMKAALAATAQVIKEERGSFEKRIEATIDRVAGSVQRAQAAAEGPVRSAALRIRGRLREIEGGSHD